MHTTAWASLNWKLRLKFSPVPNDESGLEFSGPPSGATAASYAPTSRTQLRFHPSGAEYRTPRFRRAVQKPDPRRPSPLSRYEVPRGPVLRAELYAADKCAIPGR